MIIPPTDEHHDSKEKKPEVSEKPKKPTVSDKHSTPKKEHKVKKTKKAKKNKKVKVAKKHTTSSSRLAKAESKKSAKSSTWSNNRGPKSEWTSNHGPQVNGIVIMVLSPNLTVLMRQLIISQRQVMKNCHKLVKRIISLEF